MKTDYKLSDFDFTLPDELVAQHPAAERSASRLLDGRSSPAVDRRFTDLPALLQPGDLLVLNDTKVVKARLFGQKASGGRLELLIERVLSPSTESGHEVAAHMKVSKKPLPGAVMQMDGGFSATLLGRWPNEDGPLYRFALSSDPYALMEQHGHVPLPPYITHSDSVDDERRCRPTSHTATRPMTSAATRPCLQKTRGRSLHQRPRCILTKQCWPSLRYAACSAPASRCTWARAPSSR